MLAPVGLLFGSDAAGAGDYGGPALSRKDGLYRCRYPMPFAARAEIRLINTSQEAVDFAYDLTWRPGPVGHAEYFHARYQEAVAAQGAPCILADIQGAGHFVGCTLAAENEDSFAFLEGDVTLLVDDEVLPEYRGTGTDPYFNAGSHFARGPFSTPTHGCTLRQDAPAARVCAYRTHLTDAVPFETAFLFLLEHGGQNDAPGTRYAAVVAWYQREPHPAAWPVALTSQVP